MEKNIKKFSNWRNSWSQPSQIDIMHYISYNFHPEDLLILRFLLFPELIEIDGCLFFERSFNEKNYKAWKEKLGNNRVHLEKVINHFHLYDIFANNKEEIDDSVFMEAGRVIQLSWTSYFNYKHPNKNVIIELKNNDQEYGPTIYVYQEADN